MAGLARTLLCVKPLHPLLGAEPQQLSTATLFLPKNSAVRAAVKEMNMTVDELMVDEQLLSQAGGTQPRHFAVTV